MQPIMVSDAALPRFQTDIETLRLHIAFEIVPGNEPGFGKSDPKSINRIRISPARNQAVLRYRDRLTGDAFVADVPNARALAAFHHPNVYRPARAAA